MRSGPRGVRRPRQTLPEKRKQKGTTWAALKLAQLRRAVTTAPERCAWANTNAVGQAEAAGYDLGKA